MPGTGDTAGNSPVFLTLGEEMDQADERISEGGNVREGGRQQLTQSATGAHGEDPCGERGALRARLAHTAPHPTLAHTASN